MIVVHAMLSNAAIAALLAIMALAVGRLCRSPAVRHAAWVIVLLKLVTPPLFNIPLPVLPASWGPQPGEPSAHLILSFTTGTETATTPANAPVRSTWWQRNRPSGVAEWLARGLGRRDQWCWFVWQLRRVLRFRRQAVSLVR